MPTLFNTPLDTKLVVREFAYEKMFVANSKKVPMFPFLHSADKGGGLHTVIFKNGDDLRQDILTLQLIKLLDQMWLQDGLDLKMTPYNVVGTHCMQGYIEFNKGVKNLADLQRTDDKLMNTFNDTVVMDHFRKEATKQELAKLGFGDDQELAENEKKMLEKAIEDNIYEKRKVFAKSCAGYAVASYVLGLGDRHPDNIQIAEDGRFLHIDFGHFLGPKNKKKKKIGPLVIKRETDPFVFTPEVAYFVNGEPLKLSLKERIFGTNRGNI
jgi:phosphatidylinositol-4,5-bisphosphate 3-kinase catalytic subunit alpha/beta/delta